MGALEGWEPRTQPPATRRGWAAVLAAPAAVLAARAAELWRIRIVRQAVLAAALLAAVRGLVALPAYPGATTRRAVHWAQHTNVDLARTWRAVAAGPVGQWARATLGSPATPGGAAAGSGAGAPVASRFGTTAAAGTGAASGAAALSRGPAAGRRAAAGAPPSGRRSPAAAGGRAAGGPRRASTGAGANGSNGGGNGNGSGNNGNGSGRGPGHLVAPVRGGVAAWFVGAGLPGSVARPHPYLDFTVPPGSPVGAAAAGVVAQVGFDPGGNGLFALVDHGGGWQSLYGLCGRLSVAAGDAVSPGQPICLAAELPGGPGSAGTPGAADVQVRFALLHGGRAVDPAPYLGLVPPHG